MLLPSLRYILLVPFLLTVLFATATVQPADKAILNFTQVMFEFDEYPGADAYTLRYYATGSSEILTKRTASLACLVNGGLNFGGSYEWYYEAYTKGKKVFKSKIFSFSIAQSFLIIKDQFRYKVLKNLPDSFQNNLIFIDYLGVAINRSGEPVWYMPNDSAVLQKVPQYRNLEMTANGTFTFLRGDQCYEKDRLGQLLWQGPGDGAVSGAGREWYHHDFTKAKDGTYFTCSYRYDSTQDYYNPSANIQVRYNTVIQYNNEGKVLWQWNEKDHVSREEILKTSGHVNGSANGTHMNGFAWNEAKQQFIFSFRNNSTLLKVDKASGNVMYRLRGDEGTPFGTPANFYNQHSPVYMPDGNIMLYNNNVQPKAGKAGIHYPHVMIMNIPDGKATPRLLWDYECAMKEEYPDGWIGKEGYAGLLPNGNILVCVGGANKIFEVTPRKKIVWEMNCEMYSSKENKWVQFNNYRSHFTSSLYPQYFTAQHQNGNWKINSLKPIVIKLNNDGTDAETYTVELFSNNVFRPFRTIVKLKAGTSLTQTIAFKRNAGVKLEKGSVAVLRITPASDPTGAKDYTIPVTNIR